MTNIKGVPPGGVWLLVRHDIAWGTQHYCVRADKYSPRGRNVWNAEGQTLTAHFDTEDTAITQKSSNIRCWFPVEHCSIICEQDAVFLEEIPERVDPTFGYIRTRGLFTLPEGFWDRNRPHSDLEQDRYGKIGGLKR